MKPENHALNLDTVDPLALVDPQLRPALEVVLRMIPPVEEVTPPILMGMRARGTAMAKRPSSEPPVQRRTVPARPTSPPFDVYVINAGHGSRPAILHLHGGGFVAGSAAASVADMQVVAGALDCVVVTVEYRLAPEHAHPAALDDNLAALEWLFANADELGVDRSRVALLGESAGGGHAAMLAIAARDRSDLPIRLQALTYPMLDDRTGSTVRTPAHVGAYLWRPNLNVAGWTALLGTNPLDRTADGPAPARRTDVSGLPATFIGVGAIDLFVEEDIEFARRLLVAGVPTELVVVPGAYHGFDVIAPDATVSKHYRLTLLNALATAFGQQPLQEAPEPAPHTFPLPSSAEGDA